MLHGGMVAWWHMGMDTYVVVSSMINIHMHGWNMLGW
jgi:hypothetical protein